MMEEHEELTTCVNAWVVAELRGDIQALKNMLTDDFVGVGPFGFLLTKSEWLDRHESGVLTYTSFALSELKIRVYQNAAIVIGHQTSQGNYKGQSIPGDFRVSLFFVKKDDMWHMAGQQLSILGQPK